VRPPVLGSTAGQGDDNGAIVKLLMLTAQRSGEIAGLCWLEIDFDRGVGQRDRIGADQACVPPRTKASRRDRGEHILDKGLQAPVFVRADGARFVLVEGLHRLEAAKALGEQTIVAFLVDARKH
jgi:integrase